MGPDALKSTDRPGRAVLRVFTAIAAATLLAGCSTVVEGRAVKASVRPGSSGVDVALLDPGNYPRRPSPPLALINWGDVFYLICGAGFLAMGLWYVALGVNTLRHRSRQRSQPARTADI
ncbi:hypothetical protein H7I87_02705 [Mycobacterium timonense]|uniref:Lipoprotein n=2 Tax=Mycobacterium avium complex (MAC) TaxID=120793 RepID=A0AAW5SAP7_MYCBC|nr:MULTISPECIES: hypothetical protein [Mycobacterium avium complex (MAC)]MCV6991797.1 hypothetical protein [Mycobacterium bouchedurhonense]MCV6993639.1 hypothetical protein [Mycobacterium timonense]MDV3307009.1 hypothetical protein [Mycobacterium avium subsp. hominissuis]ORA41962.1 hypothetical protein BST19_26945 [Mycobacterium bouchedurhonense]ORB77264.1 hypothetical protein BST46_25480 [Mycobacterium timonense]